MKTLFSNILPLTALIAAWSTGCTPGKAFLRADTSSIEISAEDLSAHPVTVEASSSWMVDVAGTITWLDVSYEENDPNLLWVKANSRNESLASRSAEVTLVSGEGLVLTITLVQLEMDVRFEVTPQAIAPFGARDTTTRTLNVDTGLAWEVFALHGDWIVTSRGTEEDGEANLLTVGVEPTRSLDQRRDTIVLRPTNEAFRSLADSLAVVQAGIDLLVDSESMNQETYAIEVPAAGGEILLSVYSRNAWSIAPGDYVDRVTLDLAEGGSDIENGIPVVVTVAENTLTEEYRFTLVFESAGETYEYQFVQAGIAPDPEPEPEPEPTPEE